VLNSITAWSLFNVDLRGWDERYRAQSGVGPATPLLIDIAGSVIRRAPSPGRALDLACGSGRNALWLAEQGWQVTAVDGSRAAIGLLSSRDPQIDARVADLEKHEYLIEPDSWDLIAICYYLQRDLFAPAKRGVVPGGIVLAIVHIPGPGEGLTPFRLAPGELASYFDGFEILHSFEGPPRDPVHHMRVAEIAARRIE
jgi:tellurite methyltransferase